ncbi:2-amino-4-hydroxy-6-hydroxymethyldihydropteridine diphosphokinase [Thalassobacillus devorans]|uniref:2-amino-4-hydroxy-6- hydroxymethyldihydropteridine diphosphokinase n=1 Tax=Thalassobacillus devorans TaxID=279813 RepID=UPI00048A8485|nr:2-amino-4-hydroxy-6-hydroxymethyldihydropteridine diphosphokinase [Thalassobacillus devorans]
MDNQVYIALGSNIEPRKQYLDDAVAELDSHPDIHVTRSSSVYETVPVGYTEQSDFLNMVVEIETTLRPLEILDICQSTEAHLGRKREIKWGPRTIDLDILLYNQENIISERLIVPHPHMHERAFVIEPLAEINPDAYIPTCNMTVNAVLNKIPEDEAKGVVPWQRTNGEEGSKGFEN